MVNRGLNLTKSSARIFFLAEVFFTCMWRAFHRAATLGLLSSALTISLYALPHADRIIVHKSARTMELMHSGQVLKTYRIALGGEPLGPKSRQGDHRTPEGVYMIDSRNSKSQFHRSLHIS
jgi:murein L,D-transpeptidase YafK